mmetsp:Transcript_299/g.640  ORF Transcript_299/g.640 Transcript_299/m.640 type:complete len:165 (+) Transcript_299:145-639(+)
MPSKIVVSEKEWKSLAGRDSLGLAPKRNRSDNDSAFNATLDLVQQHDEGPSIAVKKTEIENESGVRTKKRPKKVKDPNKPKHPTSSYLFFGFDVRPRMRALGMAISGETLGELWRSLTPDERARYEIMAAEEKQRYWREMAVYNASLGVRPSTVTPPPNALPQR